MKLLYDIARKEQLSVVNTLRNTPLWRRAAGAAQDLSEKSKHQGSLH
jgi:hypothetical protein